MIQSSRNAQVMCVAMFVLLAGFLGLATSAAAQTAPPTETLWVITNLSGKSITCKNIAPPENEIVHSVKVDNDEEKTAFAKLTKGSIIKNCDEIKDDEVATKVEVAASQSNILCIVLALIVGIVVGLVYAYLVTAGATAPPGSNNKERPLLSWLMRPGVLLIGMDNRYSNSKVQAVGWMAALLISYFGTSFLRWHGGLSLQSALDVGISDNLLTVAGLSAATAGGAKIATSLKAGPPVSESTDDTATKDGKKTISACHKFFNDIFRSDNDEWDIGDVQMILLTAISIAVFMYNVISGWSNLPLSAHVDLPSPSNVLTFAFGGSLGGYLAKKIVGRVGSS